MALKPSALGAVTLGVTDPAVRRALMLTAERLQSWEGSRGNPLDRVLTLNDLVSDTGVLSIIRGAARDGLNNSPLIDEVRWGSRVPPPAPVNLQANGAFNNIILRCEFPMDYPWLSHFEWWRATTDNLGTASLVKTSLGPLTNDQVASSSSFYYWVRAVAIGDPPIYGPFNDTAGTLGQTSADPAYLLSVLTASITSSQLHSSLSSPISSIGTLQTQVTGVLAEIDTINATIAELNSIAAFDEDTAYFIDDVFIYDGSLYRTIADTTVPSPTPPNATYYVKIGDYTALSEAVSAHSAVLSDHETRITSAEGEVTTLASSYSALSTGLTDAEADIAANASAISAAQSSITSLNGTVSSHTSSINTLNSSVTSINGTVSGLATSVSGLQTTVTNQGSTLTSHTSSINSLNATVSGHTTSINNNASAITSVQATVTSQGASITSLSSSVSALSASVGNNTAAISIEAAVRAASVAPNYNSASTYLANALVVQSNVVYRAKVNVPINTAPPNATYWEVYTTTSAQYTLKTGVNGKIAGYGLENTGTASRFEIFADQFAVVNSSGTGAVVPFVVSGGNVFMDTAYIRDLRVSNLIAGVTFMDELVAAQGALVSAHIGQGQITSLQIANDLQSTDYVAGVSGWKLTKGPTSAFEIHNITARGFINASRFRTSATDSGQRIDINPGNDNEFHLWGVTSGTSERELASIGTFPGLGLAGNVIAVFGADPFWSEANAWTGVLARSKSGLGLMATSQTNIGAYCISTSAAGVVGQSGSSFGGDFVSSAGYGVRTQGGTLTAAGQLHLVPNIGAGASSPPSHAASVGSLQFRKINSSAPRAELWLNDGEGFAGTANNSTSWAEVLTSKSLVDMIFGSPQTGTITSNTTFARGLWFIRKNGTSTVSVIRSTVGGNATLFSESTGGSGTTFWSDGSVTSSGVTAINSINYVFYPL